MELRDNNLNDGKILFELLESIERIEANQKLILKCLEEVHLYPKLKTEEPSPKIKKEKEEEEIEEMVTIIMQGTRIRNEYNLWQTPSTERIRAYLRSGNPAAFDGLKRKS